LRSYKKNTDRKRERKGERERGRERGKEGCGITYKHENLSFLALHRSGEKGKRKGFKEKDTVTEQ
jgi:hypothetical protein